METFTSAQELHTWCAAQTSAGHTLALVPTMGFLHEGHLSLIRAATQRADRVVVSIFVNPTQFAPNEDYAAYPHKEQDDLALCEQTGAAAVFLPPPESMYAPDASTWVEETVLEKGYCGAQRPIHFRGVCTVVAKLLNIVGPAFAVFGQKDYQQVAVLKRMVRDLNFPVEILCVPIVRDADGLAKSSRNTYLSPLARTQALSLSRSLFAAKALVDAGERDAAKIEAAIRAETVANQWIPDYVTVMDSETLTAQKEVIPGHSVILIACRQGALRLIDNILL
ncbi:MAG: pantoate--beta-alanine ligase [Kiritimatiellia bacterium]